MNESKGRGWDGAGPGRAGLGWAGLGRGGAGAGAGTTGVYGWAEGQSGAIGGASKEFKHTPSPSPSPPQGPPSPIYHCGPCPA